MDEFESIPTDCLQVYLSLLELPNELKKQILNKRGLAFDPDFDPCEHPVDDDDSDWATEDEWDEEEDKARKAKSQAQLEKLKFDLELMEMRTSEMHQVRSHIDGNTITARCVQSRYIGYDSLF